MALTSQKPKVVLFHPHYQAAEYPTSQRQPLDLLSISGFPDQKGYEVVVIDASVTKDYRERVLKECANALCFGTTSIFGFQVYHSYIMAKEVKERYPSLPIIAGGWFPSTESEMVLRQGAADIVVIRQGETTFMELLEALRTGGSLEGIEGIAYKSDGNGIVRNPMREIEDLNKMPRMPYHLINFQDYWASDTYERAKTILYMAKGKDYSTTGIRAIDYFSSYGCPDNCTFCCSATLTGRRWKALEAARMVDEIDYLFRKHSFNLLTFVDANWGVSEKRVFEFCEGLLRKGVDINWAATVEAHVINKYDDEVMGLMAKSGCAHLFFGAEAALPSTLKIVDKNIKPGDISKACENCLKRGIIPSTSYIIGYPDESEESIWATLKEACEVVYRWPQVEVPIVLFMPLPGTPLHRRAVELGFKPATSLEDWSAHGNMRTELYSSIPLWKAKTIKSSKPRAISAITAQQIKTAQRCQRYYFWFGAERLKRPRKLNSFEKILNKTSRFRLKHKILRFPIEYRLYFIAYKFMKALRTDRS